MAKHPGGAPSKYDKDFHPQNFIELSRQGKCLAQIARTWDVDRDTLYEWGKKHKQFSDAIKKGRQVCEAWYIDIGQESMLGINPDIRLGMFVWMTKNIFKWTDKVELQGKDGEPIHTTQTIREETPEERVARRQMLREKIERFNSLDE